jgi:predicted phosphodiesterase
VSTLELIQAVAVPVRRTVTRPFARRTAVVATAALWLVAVSVAGMLLGLRAFSTADYRVGPAEVRVSTSFSTRGAVDAYIPIVDWGIRAHPFSAPITLNAELVSVDRTAALGAIRGPAGATAGAEQDAPGVARAALRRAALVALIGGLAGGLAGGLLLCALRPNRRIIAAGGLCGLVVAGLGVTVCALMLRGPDYGAFREPTFYAHGGELPKLLALTDQFSTASAAYESSYQQALSGLDTLIGAAAGEQRGASERSFLVGSDIHANWLTLPAFARYAGHGPVFLIGDYAQQGTPIEAAIAQQAAGLGHPTVAVSGNHDTPLVMRRFAQAGAIVLTRNGRLRPDGHVRGPAVMQIADLLVAGFDDPLERHAGSFGHRLDFTAPELAAEQQAIADWFDGLSPRPQIVMVHDFRIAEALRLHVAALSDEPLLILTGHDHRQHVDRTGNVVVADGGTLGAGGVFEVGKSSAGFAKVHLDASGWPQAVDLISADPISGHASAKRVALVKLSGVALDGVAPPGAASPSHFHRDRRKD